MSNQDSFIDEVNEEVRKDRLYGMYRRYGWIAVVLVVLLVGGAAWNEFRKAGDRADAEARGDAILAAVELPTAEGRSEALAGLGDGSGDAFLTELLAAAEFGDEAGRAAAAERLEALAARADVPPLYRDLASLKALMVGSGEIPPVDRISRLQQLTAPGAPFRAVAQEQLALAHIDAGETDAALSILTSLLTDAEASEGLRRRATQLIVALGGAADAS